MKVMTYRSPRGGTIRLTLKQVHMLEGADTWPTDWSGQKYSVLYKDLHEGKPDFTYTQIREMCENEESRRACEEICNEVLDSLKKVQPKTVTMKILGIETTEGGSDESIIDVKQGQIEQLFVGSYVRSYRRKAVKWCLKPNRKPGDYTRFGNILLVVINPKQHDTNW